MKTREELKEIILDLRVLNAKLKVPQGNCPYAYFYIEGESKESHNCDDCSDCEIKFWEKYRNDIKIKVDEMCD